MFTSKFSLGLLSATLFSASVFSLPLYASESTDFDPMGKVAEFTSKISDATNGRLNLSGYTNGHYMIHKGAPDFVGKTIDKPLFQIREASLFADVTVTDNVLFSTELEASYDFSSKNSSGREDEFEAVFNYYYFDVDVASQLDWDTDTYGGLSFRAGRVLVPFLSYNENKPNFKQSLMSQPFTAFNIVPVNNAPASFQQYGWTDTGASINWNKVIEDSGLLDVKFTVVNGLSSNVDVLDANYAQLEAGPTVRPRDGLGSNKSAWDDLSDNNDELALALKVSFAPFSKPLDFGLSWYKGAWDNAGDDDLTMYGAHFNYLEKDWTVKGEYVKADVEQTAGINVVPAAGPAGNISTGDYSMKSWYLEGSYTPYRYGVDKQRFVKLVARYDDVDTNDKATFNPFDRSRITLGTEWQFAKNMRLRYEAQKHKIDNFSAAPTAFVTSGGSEDVYMHMFGFIMSF